MRQPKPWFHKQSGNWKLQQGKKQTNLGPDKTEAWAKYHKLMAASPGRSTDPTLREVFNRHLAFIEAKRAPGTFRNVKGHLTRALTFLGDKRVSAVTPDDVDEWIKRDYKHTGTTYQANAIGAVVAAINYCRLPNPLARMHRPEKRIREFYLLPEQWELLLSAVKDKQFKDYCEFGLHSGARPQEIRAMEARHYDKANGRIHFPKQEAKGKKRPRFIYLNETAREIVERNLDKGPILRNRIGNAWTPDTVVARFSRLKLKLDMPELCAYTLRHSFAVAKLMEGEQATIIAGLMGHVNSRRLEEVYGHIQANPTLMLAALRSSPSQSGSQSPA